MLECNERIAFPPTFLAWNYLDRLERAGLNKTKIYIGYNYSTLRYSLPGILEMRLVPDFVSLFTVHHASQHCNLGFGFK